MKKSLLLLAFFGFGTLFSQNAEEAKTLVNEGIAYHDKGDYEGAIKRYDKALEVDKDNLLALAEKAYSLNSLKKNDECIEFCKRAIEKHPGDKDLRSVYVTYGNALDALNKTDQSIEIYDKGIKAFPQYYQLYFNKGVTLSTVKKYDEALLCFENAVKYNPRHASSHNAIGRLLYVKNKHIPSLLAFCRFFVLETESERATQNLEYVRKIVKANVEKTGKKSVTVNVSPEMLADTATNGKPKENSFSTTDLLLSMSSALDFDKKNLKKTEVENFIRKFEGVCSSLKETKNNNFGFYWDYYVPYFIELKDKGFLETLANIVYYPAEDKLAQKWVTDHKTEVKTFFDWSKAYGWYNK